MSRYPRQSYGKTKYQVEAEESTDPARLHALARRKSNFVQSAVAANKHTGTETLSLLALSENRWTRKAVARNPAILDSDLALLAADSDADVRAAVGYNPSTAKALLATLAYDLSPDVRVAAAWNRNTSPEDLTMLAHDGEQRVRVKVAKNTSTPDEVLIDLVADSSSAVRDALVNRNFQPDAPTRQVQVRRFNGRTSQTVTENRRVELGGRFSPDLMRTLATSPEATPQFRVASQPDAPEDALLLLARTTSFDMTLRIIAENVGATSAALHAVALRKETESLKAVATHPATSDETLTMIALSASRSAHHVMAHKRPGGLPWLAEHPDPKARLVAAKHVGDYTGSLDDAQVREVTLRLLTDEDSAVQVAAATSVPTGFVDTLSDHGNAKVRRVVAERSLQAPVLASLATDESTLVRRAVAKNSRADAATIALLSEDRDARVRASAGEQFLNAFMA